MNSDWNWWNPAKILFNALKEWGWANEKLRKERSGSMLICPSILSVKKEEYPRVINLLEKIKVSMLHLDVMDGDFAA